jgi:phenylacetate-coenzyme A ligase PaaK-like adenylate-forming protein
MICSGRTDDMLILGGINVFLSAIKDIISKHFQELTGEFRIILTKPPVGSAVDPPLRIEVEHTGYLGEEALKKFDFNLEGYRLCRPVAPALRPCGGLTVLPPVQDPGPPG